MPCAMIVGSCHCIFAGFGNISSSSSGIGTFGSRTCASATIGIGNQTTSISSSLLAKVMKARSLSNVG